MKPPNNSHILIVDRFPDFFLIEGLAVPDFIPPHILGHWTIHIMLKSKETDLMFPDSVNSKVYFTYGSQLSLKVLLYIHRFLLLYIRPIDKKLVDLVIEKLDDTHSYSSYTIPGINRRNFESVEELYKWTTFVIVPEFRNMK